MTHQFNLQHASQYGVNEAIFIQNFIFWIQKNKANKKHFYEGRTWFYNSAKAFEELFWYMKPRTVRTTLESLIKQGVIITGNFNETQYDRTKWYAFYDEANFFIPTCQNRQIESTDFVTSICQNRQMEVTNLTNPIYSKDTDNIPDSYFVENSKNQQETSPKTKKNAQAPKETLNPLEAIAPTPSPYSAPPPSPPSTEPSAPPSEEDLLWSKFMRFCKDERVENIFKMASPLTPKEFKKLYDDFHLENEANREIFKDKVIALDNEKKHLKEKVSTYKTLRNWLRMHKEKFPNSLTNHQSPTTKINQLPDLT